MQEILEEIQEEKEELAKQRALAAVAAMETQERTAQSPAPDPLEVGPSSHAPVGSLADPDFATSGGFLRTTLPFVNEDDGPVLVAAKDERMCLQLEACIVHGGGAVMRAEWDRFLLAKAEVHKARQKGKKKAGAVDQQQTSGQPGGFAFVFAVPCFIVFTKAATARDQCGKVHERHVGHSKWMQVCCACVCPLEPDDRDGSFPRGAVSSCGVARLSNRILRALRA